MATNLRGKKIAMLVANGFEQVEMTEPIVRDGKIVTSRKPDYILKYV